MNGVSAPETPAYRALQPVSLCLQVLLLVVAEVMLFVSYGAHEAQFHWATHFLVALTAAAIFLLAWLLRTGAPGPRLLLLPVLGFHLYAMTPDLLFRVGVPHAAWMEVFLGHLSVHHLPGGDRSWLVLGLTCSAGYVAALSLWLRARWTEALAGVSPDVACTGMAALRPIARSSVPR